jgi:multidrug transporter EmrE-like cation transporter
MWRAVVPWVGAHVLHLAAPITVLPAGSGDTTWNWVQQAIIVAVSALVALVWSAVDRRTRHPALHDGLRTYVRYSLGFVMLSYGVAKVIKLQFPYPFLDRLVEPYGEFSPMGVLWSFMGVSPAYNFFTGMGEAVGGVLLFFRRTTTLGALLVVAVMANVVMLNFAYDVPVKLFSSNLLLMAFFLLAPHAGRMADALVLHRAVPPEDIRSPWAVGRKRWARWAVKAIAVTFGAVLPLWSSWKMSAVYGDKAPKPPLYGIWDVATFVRNQDTLPPLLTDTTRWRRVVLGRPGALFLRTMNDSLRRYSLSADTVGHTLALTPPGDSTRRVTLSYARADSNHLALDGMLEGDSVHVRLTRVDDTHFMLPSRGFHWVNEHPFNR